MVEKLCKQLKNDQTLTFFPWKMAMNASEGLYTLQILSEAFRTGAKRRLSPRVFSVGKLEIWRGKLNTVGKNTQPMTFFFLVDIIYLESVHLFCQLAISKLINYPTPPKKRKSRNATYYHKWPSPQKKCTKKKKKSYDSLLFTV